MTARDSKTGLFVDRPSPEGRGFESAMFAATFHLRHLYWHVPDGGESTLSANRDQSFSLQGLLAR